MATSSSSSSSRPLPNGTGALPQVSGLPSVTREIPQDILDDLLYLADDVFLKKLQYKQLLYADLQINELNMSLVDIVVTKESATEKIASIRQLLLSRKFRSPPLTDIVLDPSAASSFRQMIRLDSSGVSLLMSSLLSESNIRQHRISKEIADVIKNDEFDDDEKMRRCMNVLL